MPRVLVVDDEAPFCRAMQRMVEQAGLGYSVTGLAYDGEQALELLSEHKPDVLITDIRMQVMDGLELIGKAKRLYPDLVTVIVSAYDDFDYAQQAIRLGADDYLLKPVTIPVLQDLLRRVRDKVQERTYSREIRTLRGLLDGSAVPLPQTLCFPQYLVLLACAGSYSKVYVDSMHPGKVFWQATPCEQDLEGLLPPGGICRMLDGIQDNERIIVIGIPEAAETGQIEAAVSAKLMSAAAAGRVPLTLVSSGELPGLSALRQTGAGLRRSLVSLLVFGHSLHIREEEVLAPESRTMQSAAGILEELAEPGGQRRFEQEFRKACQFWEEARATQAQLEAVLRHLLFAWGKKLGGIRETELSRAGMELDYLLSHSVTYGELFEGITYLFKGLAQSGQDAPDKPPGYQEELAGQIELYLQEYYASPITLQDLSRRFGLVPNYLSALFKKQKGLTPGEYLTRWRMKQAKRLMEESPRPLLREVAERVGYSDPLYFSRVFKKSEGVSPSDYLK